MWSSSVAKKVIQVPINETLLVALDRTSRKQNKARAQLVREACQSYLAKIECEELDRLYQAGYERLPEEPGLGDSQVAVAGESLPEEQW
jgi:hypothetical protein